MLVTVLLGQQRTSIAGQARRACPRGACDNARDRAPDRSSKDFISFLLPRFSRGDAEPQETAVAGADAGLRGAAAGVGAQQIATSGSRRRALNWCCRYTSARKRHAIKRECRRARSRIGRPPIAVIEIEGEAGREHVPPREDQAHTRSRPASPSISITAIGGRPMRLGALRHSRLMA